MPDVVWGVEIVDPQGNHFPIKKESGGHYRNGMNHGLDVSVTLDGEVYLEQYAQPSVDGGGNITNYWSLNAKDQNGAAFNTPPMAGGTGKVSWKRGAAPTTEISLIDYPRWQLSRPKPDYPTFKNTTPATVINLLCLNYLVTDIQNPNAYDHDIVLNIATEQFGDHADLLSNLLLKYDVHDGTSIAHISQLLRDSGYEWRIGLNGNLQWVDVTYTEDATVTRDAIEEYWHAVDMTRKVSQITMTSMRQIQTQVDFPENKVGFVSPSALPNALTQLTASDESTDGMADFVTAFDSGGNVCQVFNLHPSINTWSAPAVTSSGPATQISFAVFPPEGFPTQTTVTVLLHIQGLSPIDGIDPSWKLMYPAIDNDPDPRRDPTTYRSPNIPTASAAVEVAPLILFMAQKGWYTAGGTSADPLFTMVPAQVFQYRATLPTMRVDSLHVAFSDKLSTVFAGWEPLYLQGAPT